MALPFGQLLELADWDALGADDAHRRLEVSRGKLLMTPSPAPDHQDAMTRLAYLFSVQLADGWRACGDVDVVLSEHPLTVRSPDVLVTTAEARRRSPVRFAAADVVLALEILSPGTRRTDRVTKFAEYAEAGIRQYWLVDLDAPATVSAYTLAGADYEPDGEFTGTVTLEVHGAGTVTVDLDALTADRPQRP